MKLPYPNCNVRWVGLDITIVMSEGVEVCQVGRPGRKKTIFFIFFNVFWQIKNVGVGWWAHLRVSFFSLIIPAEIRKFYFEPFHWQK